MKKYLVLMLAFGLVFNGFAKQKKGEGTITLTEVSSSLSVFEADEDKNFVKTDYIYKKVGLDKYDSVFKESATISATIAQIAGTINLIKEKKVEKTSDFVVKSLAFAVKDLPGMEAKIKALQDKIKNLDPKADFKGTKARNAPKAASGLKLAGEQLKDSLTKLPALLKDLSEITGK